MARTKKEETPVFDYTNYSRKQQKRTTRQTLKLQNLAQRLEDYTLWADDEAFEDGLDQFDELQETITGSIAKWIVSVPASWLVPDAPAALDWNDPTSLDWIRADKFQELSQAAAEARTPAKVSGNSAKR
jgi:hypothetical protein